MPQALWFHVRGPDLHPIPVPRTTGDREYPMTVYPVTDDRGSASWVVAHLFRDVYGSHRWVLHTYTDADLSGIKDASNRVTYFMSPGCGAAEAKRLTIDLLYHLNGGEDMVPSAQHHQRQGVVIAKCDACLAKHVWWIDQNGDRRWQPMWCWHCHETRPTFTKLP
jgi:hypothetical protein